MAGKGDSCGPKLFLKFVPRITADGVGQTEVRNEQIQTFVHLNQRMCLRR
jgi:hypothetical protein